MKLYIFIPVDRTKGEEACQVAARSLSEAILFLFPEGAADSNKAFYKPEWSIFSAELEHVL